MAKILGNDIVTTEEMAAIREASKKEFDDLTAAVRATNEFATVRINKLQQQLFVQQIISASAGLTAIVATALALIR